jgi:hypothetical protein
VGEGAGVDVREVEDDDGDDDRADTTAAEAPASVRETTIIPETRMSP